MLEQCSTKNKRGLEPGVLFGGTGRPTDTFPLEDTCWLLGKRIFAPATVAKDMSAQWLPQPSKPTNPTSGTCEPETPTH